MSAIAENLESVNERIVKAAKRAGRNPDDVTLVAVTKTHGPEVVQQAIDAGQKDFGENYVQESRNKIDTINDPSVRWHFIGHLQSNKAKFVAPDFYMVQTVDTPKLAAQLGKRAIAAGRILPVLLEVNVSGESQKAGMSPENAKELMLTVAATEGLALKGLMTMPPFLPAEQARPYFVALRKLRDELAQSCPAGSSLDELSMGMSGDFEVAVEEGATIVRVGTTIFGAREYK